MQCHCGTSSTKQSATCKGHTLTYDKCKGCGRQDGYELTSKDQKEVIATGQEARELYVRHEEKQSALKMKI